MAGNGFQAALYFDVPFSGIAGLVGLVGLLSPVREFSIADPEAFALLPSSAIFRRASLSLKSRLALLVTRVERRGGLAELALFPAFVTG